MRNVAEMSGETLGYDIRAAKVVRPHEFAGKTYIGPVLISIGLITFIAAAFYNVFRSYSKNFLWKFKGTEFDHYTAVDRRPSTTSMLLANSFGDNYEMLVTTNNGSYHQQRQTVTNT